MKFKGEQRLGEEGINNQGCLMKIVVYNNANDIIVEFCDKYKARVCTGYGNFKKGNVKNPYYPDVYGVGILGEKYPSKINYKNTKEYIIWRSMLMRCFDEKYRKKQLAYEDVCCCEEWLFYENFYEWLHGQENFDKWEDGEMFAIDKDILVKENRVYSPATCLLVPKNVNSLFIKQNRKRGELPIGVSYCKEKDYKQYRAYVSMRVLGKRFAKTIGYYDTPEKAFYAYKQYKEKIIKQLAQEEYDKGNITKRCYEAMMNYKVEIDD